MKTYVVTGASGSGRVELMTELKTELILSGQRCAGVRAQAAKHKDWVKSAIRVFTLPCVELA